MRSELYVLLIIQGMQKAMLPMCTTHRIPEPNREGQAWFKRTERSGQTQATPRRRRHTKVTGLTCPGSFLNRTPTMQLISSICLKSKSTINVP